jgi:hypothetical protein
MVSQTELIQNYRERAAECDRAAAVAIKSETRETMLYLACRWRALAIEGAPSIPKPTWITMPQPLLVLAAEAGPKHPGATLPSSK